MVARQLLKSHNLFRLGCPKEKKLRRLLLHVEICCLMWTHWDLNPGPSACEADVIPLHHVPLNIRAEPFVSETEDTQTDRQTDRPTFQDT